MAAISLMIAAGWMNWRFMTSLATDERDGLALGLASIGIDGLKAALAYLIALGWDRRQWGYVAVAIITYGLLAVLSLASSFGFAAESRDAVLSGRSSLTARYDAVAKELGEVEGKLKVHGLSRAAGVIASEVAGLEKEPRWRLTKACAAIRGAENAAFCRAHAERITELAKARSAEAMEERRDELRRKLTELTGKGALRPPDRQTRYASTIGLSEEALRNSLLLLLAFVMEFAAGMGFYLALRPLSQQSRPVSVREHLRQARSLRSEGKPEEHAGTRRGGSGAFDEATAELKIPRKAGKARRELERPDSRPNGRRR